MKCAHYYPYVVEIHAVDHCNLNCKGCSHFAPLVQGEVFTDLTSFRGDMKRLHHLFQRVYEIRIMGGEPLLHPEIVSFFKTAREFFPQDPIVLYTNGTLLGQMPDTFWRSLSTLNISINISNYPVELPLDAILGKSHEFGVGTAIPKQIHSFFKAINLKGDSSPRLSYRNCQRMFKTTQLRDGKIYPCSFPAYAPIFNAYFKLDIPVTEKDSISLHESVTSSEILSFLKKSIPLCKMCLERRPFETWGYSNKEIDEWVGTNTTRSKYFLHALKQYPIFLYHEIKRRKLC